MGGESRETEKKEKTCGHWQSVDNAGQEEGGWDGGGYGGINGNERRVDTGWWVHSTVYRWSVVELCTWTCIILFTSVTPVN